MLQPVNYASSKDVLDRTNARKEVESPGEIFDKSADAPSTDANGKLEERESAPAGKVATGAGAEIMEDHALQALPTPIGVMH